jgi:tetratricopeptide (TPR) repeat protein
LYVYQSCMYIFHRLFVEVDDNMHQDGESIEDIFERVQKVFESYHLDAIYYHMNLVFEFLKLEYYNHYKVFRQAEKFYEEVNDAGSNLLVNYPTFTFPAQFLISKIERHLRLGTEAELYNENEGMFIDFEIDSQDIPKHIVYTIYRALSCYYADKHDEAAKVINNLLNEVSLKKYPYAQLEIKSLLALQYTLLKDYELFNQLSNSIQRQIRLFGKDSCENIQLFIKILKISTSEAKKEKSKKINAIIPRLSALTVHYFSPTKLVKLDEKFIRKLTDF